MFSHTKSDDFCGSKTTRWLDKHRLNLWTDADSGFLISVNLDANIFPNRLFKSRKCLANFFHELLQQQHL